MLDLCQKPLKLKFFVPVTTFFEVILAKSEVFYFSAAAL